MRLVLLLLLPLIMALCSVPTIAYAAPRAEPWPLWERHDDANRASIDHAVWADFLRRHLKPGQAGGPDLLAYADVSPQQRQTLQLDVQNQAALPISIYARAEQRAYWTNLYNELTVVTVLLRYPVDSITNINLSPGLFSARGPWEAKLVTVEGTPLSLNDIEHRILRPIWHDPRTHYSVNCASLGCPSLAAVPYTAANMESLLDAGARRYVNSPAGAQVIAGKLTASRIYDWYQSDFGGTEAGVIAHLRGYAAPDLARELETIQTIDGFAYDWRLNDAGSEAAR